MMLQAVAFDLDDTLYPEMDFVRGGYRAAGSWAARKWGVDIYDDLMRLFRQGRRGDLFTPALAARGLPCGERDVLPLVQVYRGHPPDLRPYPEVAEVLVQLRSAGLRLGVITDGWWQVQDRKWRALGLDGFFDAVIFSDAGGCACWKPAVWPYLECAGQLGVPPKKMAYVGDNPSKDFIGARGLGMFTVQVQRPGCVHADNADASHAADVVVADLQEAVASLLATVS